MPAVIAETARPPQRFALRAGVPVGVAALLLVFYWVTLAPTISERDAGELASAVHTMGVPHPTGYPLYLVAGKLFDVLPLGEPARRIAFFSAVSGAAAGGLIAWVIVALTGSAAAGALGGLAAGLNWSVWPEANQVEVYALHAFFVSLLLVVFVRWERLPDSRHLNQLALVSGLALTHHRTSLFFILPLMGWAIISTSLAGRKVAGQEASSCPTARTLLWGLAPLLLYLWLPFRSAQHPPVNWGNTSASLANFLDHVGGRLYLPFVLTGTPSDAMLITGHWLAALLKQFLPMGLALALVGAVCTIRLREHRALGISLGVVFIATAVWTPFYNVLDRDVFYMPAVMVLAVWFGAGLGHLLRGVRRLWPGSRLGWAVVVCAVAVAVAVPVNMVARNWKLCNRSGDWEVREYTELMMAGVPANAVLLLAHDEPYASALYYWYVLRRGPAPAVLGALNTIRPWCEPLLEPQIRRAAVRARRLAPEDPTTALDRLVRESLDPTRPLYVSQALTKPPPGYVVAVDYTLSRVVRPPVIAEARDEPGGRPVLELPQGAGELQGLSLPAQTQRGRPFPVTAHIRWAGGAPQGDLGLVFAREDVAEKVRRSRPDTTVARREGARRVPLLFALDLPASRRGYHYDQAFYALLGRELLPGRYRVFVQTIHGHSRTALAPAGVIEVR